MARNAGRARARKGERKDIIYIYIYMQISFLFSYISYLEIYCMYVYVDRELVGHEDIEQNLNALLPQFPETGGIFLHTISDTLPMCVRVRVCVCMWKVLQSTSLSYHTFLRGNKLTFS